MICLRRIYTQYNKCVWLTNIEWLHRVSLSITSLNIPLNLILLLCRKSQHIYLNFLRFDTLPVLTDSLHSLSIRSYLGTDGLVFPQHLGQLLPHLFCFSVALDPLVVAGSRLRSTLLRWRWFDDNCAIIVFLSVDSLIFPAQEVVYLWLHIINKSLINIKCPALSSTQGFACVSWTLLGFGRFACLSRVNPCSSFPRLTHGAS